MSTIDDEEDIEKELANENVSNEIPFNPNDININIVPRTIGQLVEMLEYNEILIPKYQRLPDLWDNKKKSRFIESLMLNLPIPLFYFDEGDDKKWRVIDGLQRISTLENFILSRKKVNSISKIAEPLRLQELEFRTQYNGNSWDELPRDVQRRISTNQVTINLIGKGTPEKVKFNIFSRINQGGVELEPQEIRTALFQGYRIEFLEELVSEDSIYGQAFLSATDNSIPFRRQQDLDFATRFVSFYLIGYKDYEPDMESFLTKGTNEIPRNPILQNSIKRAFKESMDFSKLLFDSNTFRKWAQTHERRKPINKSLFEVVSVTFAKTKKQGREAILNRKKEFIKKFILLLTEDRFSAAITSSTASKESVKTRNEDFTALVESFVK